jgi:D-alanyl-D-alanine carboxypeptidase/D-alanyl-D-alanine-endopeptidase (penicillin-binding protein 4)
MIFKTIPSVVDSTRGSWPLGAAKVLSWWEKCGLPGKPLIKNGSGMGNTNRISTLQIAQLLSHVWKQKTYLPEYLNALSVSGIDGTLKSRFKKSPLKGLVRGKTGTLNDYGISALAGYLLLPKGTYSFAIICTKIGDGQYDNWQVQEQTLEKFASSVQDLQK